MPLSTRQRSFIQHLALGPVGLALLAIGLLVLGLSGCSSTPKKFYQGDGPPEARDIPAQLAQTPDAVPRVEPFHPYANRPYRALGRTYTPLTTDAPLKQRGMASWYGRQFHGNKTASGERYDMYAMTAAHPTFPLPSYARVINLKTGKQIVVRVNDRGPFLHGRIIDLSYAAAVKLGIAGGVSEVEVERITHAQIRAQQERGDAEQSTAQDSALALVASPLPEPLPLMATSLPEPGATLNGAASAAPAWSIQLGAFEQAANAEALRQRVAQELQQEAQPPRVYFSEGLHRVLVGRFSERSSAQQAAQRLQQLLDQDTALFLQR